MPDDVNELPTKRQCGTMVVHERLLRNSAEYVAARVDSENRAWEFKNRMRASSRSGVTVIPVVVHVVHKTADQDISDAQVQSQIDALNKDFRRTNPDVASTPAAFAPLCADARIEFVLASTDPSGNPTSGITRTSTTAASFTDDDKVKSAATAGVDAWSRDKYLNLWCCRLAGGLLGYAQFPGGPAGTDGVVIRDTAFGTMGTAAAPFNLGRTATHEIGHWLNLRHIWGDDGTGCSGDDFVSDTPNAASENTGMPAFPHVTCNNGPNGDLFVNYMDYTDDAGMFMFTAGQVQRMQACLDGDRSSIGTTKPGPTLTFADVHPTVMVVDVQPTVATVDVHPTTVVADVHPTAARVDVGPTLAFRDVHPTVAFRDTNPQLDVLGGPTLAFRDMGGTLGAIDIGGMPGFPHDPGDPAPFVLATPHHTRAWTSSFPDLAEAELSALQAQVSAYEELLDAYARADAAGQLSATEATDAEQLYAEFVRLSTELAQLTGG
jgi:hypothetical protein